MDEAPKIIFRTAGEDVIGDAAYGQDPGGGNGRQGRLMKLAGLIDLDSKLTVSFNLQFQLLSKYVGRSVALVLY